MAASLLLPDAVSGREVYVKVIIMLTVTSEYLLQEINNERSKRAGK